MSDRFIVEVQETEDGEAFFEFPESIIEKLGWEEGDVLVWTVMDDGSVQLKRKD